MRVVAEFELYCDALPLVEVAATVPEAPILLELQFNYGERPLFLVTVTDGSHQPVADALTRDGESEPPGDGLTDNQQEARRTAYELGYFDIPRQASLEAVAAELDISASSVSERLRRAQTRLVEETVATTWPPLPE
jgi:hypothetical protein